MSEEPVPIVFGHLMRLQAGHETLPTVEILHYDIEREEAKRYALAALNNPLLAFRQILFVHRDGALELWDKGFLEYIL